MIAALKQKSIASIVSVLLLENTISRAHIAQLTGLTPATVSKIISKLEDLDIIRIIGPGESRGGRRPILLELNPDAFYLAGVDIGFRKSICLVTDLHGKILAIKRFSMSRDAQDVEEAMPYILDVSQEVFSKERNFKQKIKAIGLSYPGLVDYNRGLAVHSTRMPKWHNAPLVKMVSQRFNVPTILENDAKAMAVGESRFGSAKGCKNIVAVTLGYGIGAGIIINGELYRGHHAFAGQLGHITVTPSGPICSCGNKGCLQMMASGIAIAASAQRMIRSGAESHITSLVDGRIEDISAKEVALAAQEGDKTAMKIMMDAANFIGIAMANVVSLLNPEVVVIGGGISKSGDYLIQEINRIMKERVFSYDISAPRMVVASLEDRGSAIGAATLAFDSLISTNSR
jgi:glucokinase-like ROK family protein